MRVGAVYDGKSCEFVVWAPSSSKVTLQLGASERYGLERVGEEGYWRCAVDGVNSGSEYTYRLDDQIVRADPASNFQPRGVFGPSMVVDHASFQWADSGWHGLRLRDMIFYELHVGTFTEEGTFTAMMKRIRELPEGINAIELMPIAQFPGERNWGYDVAFPFAVQKTYGTPDDLKLFINECHAQGLVVFIDAVYNHAGPEGNFLNDFGPYFIKKRMTQWGPTVNLDGPMSGPVREYFFQNAAHWLERYHLDGMRLDAVLSMPDSSPKHFLAELTDANRIRSRRLERKTWLIAESGYNQPMVLTPTKEGGLGFDAQWLDDFQHSLHALLTGENEGYYESYGRMEHLLDALVEGYVHIGGGIGNTKFRRRRSDESFFWIASDRLIVFSQNHDQVGNRALSERLIALAGCEAAKTAAGLVLLSPYVPLLFMGEEYGETAPFNFFVDYEGRGLIESIQNGRIKEFENFHWKGEIPDPSAKKTFMTSKLNWQSRYGGRSRFILEYYKALIRLRRRMGFQCLADRATMKVSGDEDDKVIFIRRQKNKDCFNVIVANLNHEDCSYEFPFDDGRYIKVLESSDTAWAGPGKSLPEETFKGDHHTSHGFSLAVFEHWED